MRARYAKRRKKTNLLVLALAFLFPNDVSDPGGRRKDERYEDEQDDKERVEAFGDISLVVGLWRNMDGRKAPGMGVMFICRTPVLPTAGV